MYRERRYHPSDMMSELICENYLTLLVMNRFGIELGFGEETIEEVCQRSGVDLPTFLAVVNLLIAVDKRGVAIDYNSISLTAIVEYLHNSHAYFLDYRLPAIRSLLAQALTCSDEAVTMVIMNYYDEYVAEVTRHMNHEEERLFPYIRSVIEGESREEYSAEAYSKHHDKVESRLSELKSIIIKYYPSKTSNELTNVLYDIFTCERDLSSHTDLEDMLLVPVIKAHEATRE